MNLQTFYENFEALAEAPNGVQKLRELVLQLAVQGKLVPQDPHDESASVLLDRIDAEKEQLIKAKKIKRADALLPIELEERPYDLPRKWEWVHLDRVSSLIHYGYTASANQSLKNIRLLRITDIQNNKVDWESVPGCEIDEKDIASYKLTDGDIVIARTGGTIGKSYMVREISVCAVFASYLIRVVPSRELLPDYVKLFLESPLYWEQLYKKSMGTGQPNVNGTSLRSLVLPLPPCKEQERIIAKVDQLMKFCDEFEQRQQRKRTARVQLNQSALDHILTASTSEDFNAHWQRVCDSFDLLYDTPENIGKLSQTILQLAVQGKLVPQDRNDEPASMLLKKIKAEKERWMNYKTGKKNSLPIPFSNNDERPFFLPEGWEQVRIGDIVTLKSGSTIPQELEHKESDIPYLKVGDMNLSANVREIQISSRYVKRTNQIVKDLIPANSIIFPKRGGAIATNKKKLVKTEILADSNTMAMICHEPLLLDYLLLWFKTVDLWELNSGTSVPQINNKDIDPLWFPLPPLEEQKRIVAKVDQLMKFCDELEGKLTHAQSLSENLIASMVNHIFSTSQENGNASAALSA
jgi:Restriction endonuclease S subunits